MAVDPIFGTMLLQALGMFGSSSQAKKQARLQERSLNQQEEWLQRMWQYQRPQLERMLALQQGLDPTYGNIVGQLALLSGEDPGSTINMPGISTGQVPEYLRGAMEGPEGDQRRAAEMFLAYGGGTPHLWDDFWKDVGRGEGFENRLQRAFGSTQLPQGWQAPQAGTPGQTITVPGYDQLPEWLQPREVPDWKTPFTPEQVTAFLEGADINIGEEARRMSGSLASQMAQRGLGGIGQTSSLDMSSLAGLENWQRSAMGKARANLMDRTVARGDYLRAEQNNANTQMGNNFGNLYGYLTGQVNQMQPMTDLSPYINTYGQLAQNYGNQANMWGNMAGQGASNLGSTLGGMAAWNNWQRAMGGGQGNAPSLPPLGNIGGSGMGGGGGLQNPGTLSPYASYYQNPWSLDYRLGR